MLSYRHGSVSVELNVWIVESGLRAGMKRLPPQYRNSYVRRERDGQALARQVFLLAGALVITAGFVTAAKLHFAAVRYGYQSEELRHERARLLGERKQLELELNEAVSPALLERAAREIGLHPARPDQVESLRGEARPTLLRPATALARPAVAATSLRR
ncbi:MAG: hypothetical protein H0T45_14025 [Pyrinomonadaceae bacterium]|nr:hypothetical protein [Pyrinomonadaceae bacterium]MDQ3133328.1 hypothetical protein [Acidobacteriota bacterium]